MGKDKIRPAVNSAGRPICIECNKNLAYRKGYKKDGSPRYARLCSNCHKKKYDQGKFGLKLIKKNTCEYCGFVALHPCQLDIHHMDGNHFNNDINNLQTLCANCHRLVTEINRISLTED